MKIWIKSESNTFHNDSILPINYRSPLKTLFGFSTSHATAMNKLKLVIDDDDDGDDDDDDDGGGRDDADDDIRVNTYR